MQDRAKLQLSVVRRSPLPPDPSNTRLQGQYAKAWQQFAAHVRSSELKRSPSSSPHSATPQLQQRSPSPWPWQQTLGQKASQEVKDYIHLYAYHAHAPVLHAKDHLQHIRQYDASLGSLSLILATADASRAKQNNVHFDNQKYAVHQLPPDWHVTASTHTCCAPFVSQGLAAEQVAQDRSCQVQC